MTKLQASPKKRFSAALREIEYLHAHGAGGIETCGMLTRRFDGVVRTIAQEAQISGDEMAIVALGGYGRRELCLSSDADIMVVVRDAEGRERNGRAMQRFLHQLLALQIPVGHSFRTVAECRQAGEKDFETMLSLLDARSVTGSRVLFNEVRKSTSRGGDPAERREFINKLFALTEARHEKYGNSVKLLEPNIKNSAGGLRDLQTVFWLLVGLGIEESGSSSSSLAVVSMLRSRTIRSLFSSSFLREVRAALDFFLRIRNEMHLQARALHDTLEFALQPKVATGLHYRDRGRHSGTEQFMRDYYKAARVTATLFERTLSWARDRWTPASGSAKRRTLDAQFLLDGNRILLSRTQRLSNADVLRAFLHRIRTGAEFSFALEDLIHKNLGRLKQLRTGQEAGLFREILSEPAGVADAVRRMNALGLLERWIPEWRPLVAFFQHNQYHYYTADEHTLVVIANAEDLAGSASSFGSVFRSIPRREALYLACLLHDIGKPLRVGEHEIAGVRISRTILARLGYADIARDVTFLIRNHLRMEQVAFRRNLNDPQTISQFAREFENPGQLDLLYILTYADLAAVNKNVWTEWKEMLLFDLYKKCRAVLTSQLSSEEWQQSTTQENRAAAASALDVLRGSFPRKELEQHATLLENAEYLHAFSIDEVREHLRSIAMKEPVVTIFGQWSNYSEATVIAPDAPFLLSRVCGVLATNDANIFDASVFTREDGIVIDKFRIVDFVTKGSLPEERCAKIRQEMAEVLGGTSDLAGLMERHRIRWKRRTFQYNPNIRLDVEFEDHPRYTIVDIFAPDALGFLHRVTEAMSRMGLMISFARIATRADGIVDSFYVVDSAGRKIDDPGRRRYLKSELLRAIRAVSRTDVLSHVS